MNIFNDREFDMTELRFDILERNVEVLEAKVEDMGAEIQLLRYRLDELSDRMEKGFATILLALGAVAGREGRDEQEYGARKRR